MRLKAFGVLFVNLKVSRKRLFEAFAVFHRIVLFLFLGCFGFTVSIYLLFTPFYWLVLLYIPWYIHDYRTPERGGRSIEYVRRWSMWNHYRDYFPMSLVKTAELSPDRNYIIVCHPHGVMAHGMVNSFSSVTEFSKMFLGIRVLIAVLGLQFLIPINREYWMAIGSIDCSKRSLDWVLTRQGKGNAVVLLVGGSREALEARPGSTTLTFARRKGYARIAYEHGVSLVPVYAFGENDLYNQVVSPPGSRLHRIQTTMAKWLPFTMPLFYGRGFFDNTFGWMPFRQPINVVVGSPIEVELTRNATEEQVDALHQKYIACLNDLFETHKHKYGVEESRHLNII